MGTADDSKALMWRITDEIWNNGRLELIDELIAEDLVDHVELPGLPANGRARYRASIEMARAGFPDYRNPLDFVLADGEFAVSYGARQAPIEANTWEYLPPVVLSMCRRLAFCALLTVRQSNDGVSRTTSP